MRNAQLAALTAQLLLGTAYAAPQAIAARNAAPKVVERDGGCDVTTYTVITPKPDSKPTPVTKQFQSVYSCIPQYVVCDSSNKEKCETVYSTTSYQWVSTAVPYYQGLTTVTHVTQPVTVAAYPTNKIETCKCDYAGACVYGDYTTYVAEPTSFAYVNQGWDYYVCPFSDYYKYYSGSQSHLDVDVYSCIDGVCSIYPLGLITKTYVSTSTYQVPYAINRYFPEPTIIVIGDLDITINISIAPTTVSTVLTGTSTVTSTVTTTETTTVSGAVTVTDTTTATVSATGAPLSQPFVLAANVNAIAKRQSAARSFVAFSNGIGSLQQNCSNAAIFNLDGNGRLISAGSFIYATVNEITSGTGTFHLGNGPVTTGFSFNGGILSWINAAFTDGDHEAAFCQNGDNTVTVIYRDQSAPAGCTPLEFTRIDPGTDLSCLGINGPPISSSSGSGSSATSATGSSSTGTNTAGNTSSGNGSGSSMSGASSGATATGTGASSTGATSAATSSATGAGITSSTVGPTTFFTSTTATASSSSASVSSIGGNSNLQVCDPLIPALKAICIDLNGVDPCAIDVIVDLVTFQRCVDNGGTPANSNLVGCAVSQDITNCITSCDGTIDTVLLATTCQNAGGSPPVSLLCSVFPMTPVNLNSVCLALDGGNPCSESAINGQTVSDTLTYVTQCVASGALAALPVTDAPFVTCINSALALLANLQLAAVLACLAT